MSPFLSEHIRIWNNPFVCVQSLGLPDPFFVQIVWRTNKKKTKCKILFIHATFYGPSTNDNRGRPRSTIFCSFWESLFLLVLFASFSFDSRLIARLTLNYRWVITAKKSRSFRSKRKKELRICFQTFLFKCTYFLEAGSCNFMLISS